MGERKALVVGIDNYPSCPLYGCCNDSEAIKDLLSNHENGNPNFAVWKKDNVMTKGELRMLIEKCFEGDADVALFYYSGHGHIDSVGGYLVTPDFSEYDNNFRNRDSPHRLPDNTHSRNRSDPRSVHSLCNGCHSIAGRADASANRRWHHSKAAPRSPSRQRFLRQDSAHRNNLPQTVSAHPPEIFVRRCCIHGSLA